MPDVQLKGRPVREFSPDGEYLIEWAFGYWLGNHEVRSPRITRVRDGLVLTDLREHDWECWLDWSDPGRLRLGVQTAYLPVPLSFAYDLKAETIAIEGGGVACSWADADVLIARAVQDKLAAGSTPAGSVPADPPGGYPHTSRWVGLALLVTVTMLLIWQL